MNLPQPLLIIGHHHGRRRVIRLTFLPSRRRRGIRRLDVPVLIRYLRRHFDGVFYLGYPGRTFYSGPSLDVGTAVQIIASSL